MSTSNNSVTRPLLATLATTRTDGPDIPGRYSKAKDVWVVDSPDGEVPIISQAYAERLGEPITKVQGERDQIGLAAALEITTKTSVSAERDDTKPTVAYLAELETKTEVIRERDDAPPSRLGYLMDLVTTTRTKSERDDK